MRGDSDNGSSNLHNQGGISRVVREESEGNMRVSLFGGRGETGAPSAVTRLEPLLQALVVVAAVATIPIVVLQEQGVEHAFVPIADWAVWAVFFAELTVMAGLSGAPLAYTRRHWLSVVVVVVSFPLLPPLFALIRLARLARLLRLVRLLAVTSWGLHALTVIFGRRGMVSVTSSALLLVFSTAGLLAVLEPETLHGGFWTGVWWAVVTITTVGYGDIVPSSPAGKVLGIVLMLTGIGLVSTLAASITAYFVDQEEGSEIKNLGERLTRIESMIARLLEEQTRTHPDRTAPTATIDSRESAARG